MSLDGPMATGPGGPGHSPEGASRAGPGNGPGTPRFDYDWSVLRVVPRVHLGASVNVGVVVHARTAGFLGMEALLDPGELARRVPDVDAALLARYLEASMAVCRGELAPSCGGSSVALAPPSERFHWLTAPRSDVLQPSAVHGGVTADPAATLRRLFREQVGHDRPSEPARPPGVTGRTAGGGSGHPPAPPE